MLNAKNAAYLFCVLTAVVALFQLALALGAPWGELAMGGIYPGRFPTPMRIAAVVQAGLLVLMALIVLTRAGVILPAYRRLARTAIWFVVAYAVIGTILNTITQSSMERLLWAPTTFVLLICALYVARS